MLKYATFKSINDTRAVATTTEIFTSVVKNAFQKPIFIDITYFHQCYVWLCSKNNFFCLIRVYVSLKNFSLIWRRHNYGEGLYSGLMAIELLWFFNVPHQLVISEDP